MNYQERKENGRCTRHGCPEPCGLADLRCDKHRDEDRKRFKARARKRTSAWAKAGLCKRCGRRRSPASAWGCPACLNAVGGGKRVLVSTKSPLLSKEERISGRLIPWQDSPTNANRVRLRGGKRGTPPRIQTDEQDLHDAARGINNGLAGLKLVVLHEHRDFSKAEKRRAEVAALDHVASAIRFCRDLLARHRYDVDLDAKPINDDEDDEQMAGPTRKGGR